MSISSDTILNHNNRNSDNGAIVSGMVDYTGHPAKRSQSGYWRSACYIIGVGAAERFAYFGVSSNLITYLTGPLGQSTAAAAASINIWSGTGLLLPLLGAVMAESFLGRYRTIVLSSMLYILALGLLTASAFLNERGVPTINEWSSPDQLIVVFFFVSLYLIALGQGMHKPCILAFGADQFDHQDPQELRSRSSFFNWCYFCLCAGPLAALLVLNYIQDNISWGIGFGIPCVSMVISLIVFVLGTKSYRYNMIKIEDKCALVRVGQVFMKAVTNWRVVPSTSAYDEEDHHDTDTVPSQQYKFLNKALLASDGSNKYDEEANNNCNMQEVEEAKTLLNLLPLCATSLAFALVLAQPSTLFTKQGITMDRSIGSTFDIPAASLQYITGVTIILFIPIYDRLILPLARFITKTPTGITRLQRIGTGMCLCTLSMVTATIVERKRIKTALLYGLADFPEAKVPMRFWWLIPQYILFGIAEVCMLIGLQELFYDEVACGLKSVGLSIYLSVLGMGSFLSSFLICVIQRFTNCEGGEGGWFSDNTNRAHLDYFYELLAGLNALSFLAFLYLAKSFKYCNNRNNGSI